MSVDGALEVVDQAVLLCLCLDVSNHNPRDGLTGEEMRPYIDRVLEVDQTPIGKTPRSCPATPTARPRTYMYMPHHALTSVRAPLLDAWGGSGGGSWTARKRRWPRPRSPSARSRRS